MNIRKELLRDKVHSKEKALKITEYASASTQNFSDLIKYFLSGDYRLAQRAAWSVSNAVQKNPEIIKPYIKDLVANLAKKEVSNAIIRNSLRVLQQIDIPETLHATVMNACFKLIEKPAEPAANKAFTLTTLFNITKCYPEIKQELKLIIEDRYNTESPAFKSRAKKILSAL